MNAILNLNRLFLLIRRQWMENYRIYLISLLSLAGILSGFYLISLRSLSYGFQTLMFGMSFVIASGIFSSLMFSELAEKTKGLAYLMTPASALEKLLCSLVYSILFFLPAYLISFFLVDSIFVNIHNVVVGKSEKMLDITEKELIYRMLWIFINLQAVYLLGSVYFGKNAFIKTTAAVFLICIVLLYLNFSLLEWIITGEKKVWEWKNGKMTAIPDSIQGILKVIRFIFQYVTAPFFWLVTYFRIKEKQI